MKTSVAEANGWKCPECGGKTSQDIKRKGFVRHLERFGPKDPKVRTNRKGQCRYGRTERDS
jgi:PHP family Zn ribbon phosphoesterase